MKQPSLQRELKIARRADVIGFPQLSTPLTHTHTHKCTHTLTDPDTHRHKCGHACMHALAHKHTQALI